MRVLPPIRQSLNKVAENEESGAGREEMRTGEACGRVGGEEAARFGDDRSARTASESFDQKTLASESLGGEAEQKEVVRTTFSDDRDQRRNAAKDEPSRGGDAGDPAAKAGRNSVEGQAASRSR
jgi:hypothetical protein